MPPKNSANKGLNTRSRSVSRNRGQEPASATPDAPPIPKPAPGKRSPSREGKHPPEVEQTFSSTTVTVSNQQKRPHTTDSTNNTEIDLSKNTLENEHLNNQNSNVLEKGLSPPGHAKFCTLGDNREAAIKTDFPADHSPAVMQAAALTALTSELSAIRSRMDTLDKIENSMATLVSRLSGLADRTGKVETKVDSHSTKLTEVSAELASLKETVELQGRAIAKLTNMKSDLLKQNKEVKADLVKQNKGITTEMNQLLVKQKQQVETFRSTTESIENNIYQRVEQKVEVKVEEKVNQASQEASQEASFQSLKDQAFAKRRNLVVTGLEEDDSKSVIDSVKEFLKSMGVDKLGIHEAYRIGSRQSDNTSYHRPIVVEFHHLTDRNKV